MLIVIFFQVKNSNYLSAGNFNNLIVQMSGEALIAMGVVFVLLLGEIDLSVGFVSGIGAVLVAEFLLQGGSLLAAGMVDRRASRSRPTSRSSWPSWPAA